MDTLKLMAIRDRAAAAASKGNDTEMASLAGCLVELCDILLNQAEELSPNHLHIEKDAAVPVHSNSEDSSIPIPVIEVAVAEEFRSDTNPRKKAHSNRTRIREYMRSYGWENRIRLIGVDEDQTCYYCGTSINNLMENYIKLAPRHYCCHYCARAKKPSKSDSCGDSNWLDTLAEEEGFRRIEESSRAP